MRKAATIPQRLTRACTTIHCDGTAELSLGAYGGRACMKTDAKSVSISARLFCKQLRFKESSRGSEYSDIEISADLQLQLLPSTYRNAYSAQTPGCEQALHRCMCTSWTRTPQTGYHFISSQLACDRSVDFVVVCIAGSLGNCIANNNSERPPHITRIIHPIVRQI